MQTGGLTGYIDVAQVVLYMFWVFFAALILYLNRESKREGYPLVSSRTVVSRGRVILEGLPPGTPSPKTFLMADGTKILVPDPSRDDRREIKAVPIGPWPGAPLEPTGNPMLDGVGPAAYAERQDNPELTADGTPLIVPMRVAAEAYVDAEDRDPRGFTVLAGDGKPAGSIAELWVDRGEPQIRYMEVALAPEIGTGNVLLPIHFARINSWRGTVKVRTIMADQFATVPRLSSPDQVTKLEEDKITAYYAGGELYATAARSEPIL